MGLAASQARYLTLSARKNDLEYAAQTISSRRLQLAYKTAEIARKYSDGMNNKAIMIANTVDVGDGTFTTTWNRLDYTNLLAADMVLWGTDGKPVSFGVTVANGQEPYIYYEVGERQKEDENGNPMVDSKGNPIMESYKIEVENFPLDPNKTYVVEENPQYMEDLSGGKDIQSLLVGGRAQCISKDFAIFLLQHWDDKEDAFVYTDDKGRTATTFNEMQTIWEADHKNAPTGIDWRSDITGQMKQKYYTEDDEQVQAEYERETAEIQAQDKMLELEIKNIETQHKAIETEIESVQKVIQGNIDKTFKIFS